tara:strand:- start:14 stop:601 length:588 start_codon:yes stop_codon:yes gene_type:complete
MTTFAFVDQEYSQSSSGGAANISESIYTVPSNKIAKIKFDGFFATHNSSTSSSTSFKKVTFMLYSDGTNVHRKHMYGYHNTGDTAVHMVSFYNPVEYAGSRHNSNNGSQGRVVEYTMFAQPENAVSSGTVSNPVNGNPVGNYNFQATSSYGARVYGPGTFFMKENEVLKCVATVQSDTNDTKYINIRLAVFLEDE